MITPNNNSAEFQNSWQSRFVAILPEIKSRLRHWFKHLSPEARDEAIEDGVIHCLLSFVRLCEKGRAESVTPANLAWFAMLHVRKGRLPACRLNSKDILSRYAQLARGSSVVPLQHFDPHENAWINDVIDSKRMSIADQVAVKLDICAWLGSLCLRTRRIATDLAKGFSTSEVAHKYRLSAGRVAQMRRELQMSWLRFQGETPQAAAS